MLSPGTLRIPTTGTAANLWIATELRADKTRIRITTLLAPKLQRRRYHSNRRSRGRHNPRAALLKVSAIDDRRHSFFASFFVFVACLTS